jgi:hypothetical protein
MTMNSYLPVLIQGVFFGVAAGNIWSAPFIGGSSAIGCGIVAFGMYFPARLQSAQRFMRTALVGLIAWPVACLWQTIHHSAPTLMLGSVQLLVLLASSQLAAWLAERSAARSGNPDEDAA